MPRKRSKVVLIIVEGPTDETALEQFFSENLTRMKSGSRLCMGTSRPMRTALRQTSSLP